MLGKLFIHYKKSDHEYKDNPFAEFRNPTTKACLNANQYLRLYGKNNAFDGMFLKDDRTRLFGGWARTEHPRYKYDVVEYYKDLKTYLDEMEINIKQDPVINNFVRMFTLICGKASENDKLVAIKPNKIE